MPDITCLNFKVPTDQIFNSLKDKIKIKNSLNRFEDQSISVGNKMKLKKERVIGIVDKVL